MDKTARDSEDQHHVQLRLDADECTQYATENIQHQLTNPKGRQPPAGRYIGHETGGMGVDGRDWSMNSFSLLAYRPC